jgi:crossover junction endodeoxyribonuclease RuvC
MKTRILGIDPGLQRTGWGIIDKVGNNLSFVAAGVITSKSKETLDQRLQELHDGIIAAVAAYHPHVAAVEETFVSVNGASTLKLGQARGAILLTLSLANLAVYEYAATKVKKTVTGVGRAEKHQVIHMMKILLPGSDINQPDAADALAVAICHANYSR